MIKVEKLTKKFGSFTALDNISFSIGEGCIYGLVGSNGAGKSTLIRTLAGVYKPDGGEVTVDNEKIWENPAAKKRVAYVSDELYFQPGANIKKTARDCSLIFPGFDTELCEKLTGVFGLDKNQRINTFSKGMRRQTAIIMALCRRADYVFFDETFDGLDPLARNCVKGLIAEEIIARGASAVITSHSLRELEDTCDRLALLHKGGMVFESEIADLKTTKFKVQTAFSDYYDEDRFAGINVLHFSKSGAVCNMIVSGDRDEVEAKLRGLDPLLLDILPLSLEEVFTYELEALGYAFDRAEGRREK